MEFLRAKQIFSSPGHIDVWYKGDSIWIENLDESNHTAEIKNLESDEKLHVPVSLLFEV